MEPAEEVSCFHRISWVTSVATHLRRLLFWHSKRQHFVKLEVDGVHVYHSHFGMPDGNEFDPGLTHS